MQRQAINGIYHNITGYNDLVSVGPATMASEFVQVKYSDAPAVFFKASCPCHVALRFAFSFRVRWSNRRRPGYIYLLDAAALGRPPGCNAFGCRSRRLGWLCLVCISCQSLLVEAVAMLSEVELQFQNFTCDYTC